MLPSTVENFDAAVWVPVPGLNGEGHPVAEILVLPYTYDDTIETYEKFGICKHCDGGGLTLGVRCQFCQGKPESRQSDPAVRQYLIEKLLTDWRGVLVKDVSTGEVRDLPFTPTARLGLAKIITAFTEVLRVAMQLGSVQDATKKDSSTAPPVDSPTVSTPQAEELKG